MIIWRYLTKEVYGTMLATTAIVLMILISNQFIHYLNQAASGSLPLRTVMQMMSLQVPLLLGILLPLGLFLGILLAYGRFYADQEMTVLFACGVSKKQLLYATVVISAFIAIIVAILMMWLEPKMTAIKRHLLQEAASASPLQRIYPDQFLKLNNGKLILYVKQIADDRSKVEQVFIAQHDDKNIWNIIMADSAHQIENQNGRYIVFDNGYRYTGTPGQLDYQIAKFAQYGVRLDAKPPELVETNPDSLSTRKLWQMRSQGPDYQAELQWRFSLPLSVLLLALLAIPLSQVKPRQGRYAQLVPAVILYIVYVDLLFLTQAWVQKGSVAAFPGMWWVHVLMLILAISLIWRFNRS